MEIGTVEGAVNTEQFHFEAHDDVEKFDFVTVKANTDEAEWLLAQIDSVEKKPLKDSEKTDSAYKTVATANIIGYRSKGLLKKPRSVIEPDSIVYGADQDVISDVLGLDEDGLYMGLLMTDPGISIYLDPEELYKHIAVLAKTGAGKSYATGVMVEELLENEYPVIIVDPHGEYHSLGVENDEIDEEARDTYRIEGKGYPVKQFSPNTDLNEQAEKLTFSSRNLSAKELQQIVPTNLTNSQLGVLYTALRELKKRDSYDLDDLVETCTEQDSKAKWNLINMLETVQDSGMYSPDPTRMQDLLEPGRATVINLRGVDPENQELTVYMLAKELFEMRKRGELEPFIMIMEEAHNFVPEKGMGKAACSDILRKIASEGRKFGLGLGVISQRPANVAKNILSQCNTQLIMRVTNPNDLSAISRSFEGVTNQVEKSITSLPPGTGLVLGKEYPIMTDIRTRRSKHGGTTKDVSEEDGIEKREQARKQGQQDTGDGTEPGTSSAGGSDLRRDATGVTEGAGGGGSSGDAEQERQPVESFEPEMGLEEAERRFDDVRRALYPVHIVETKFGSLAIDAEDGTIKDRQLNLTKQADAVLDAVKDERRTITEISEQCRIKKETVVDIVERLAEYGLIDERNKGYRKTGSGVLNRKIIELDAARSKVIETKIGEDEARDIADRELGAEVKEVRTVYYPYYTSGDRVFDAVLGKEV